MDPENAMKDGFPKTSFSYSQMTPMSIRFKKPYNLQYFWMKKHRDSQYWNKADRDTFHVTAYRHGKLLLNATIVADTLHWRKYSPTESLVIDHIVFPPGVDVDNLFIYQGEIGGTEEAEELQKKTKVMNQLIEKTWLTKGTKFKTDAKTKKEPFL